MVKQWKPAQTAEDQEAAGLDPPRAQLTPGQGLRRSGRLGSPVDRWHAASDGVQSIGKGL